MIDKKVPINNDTEEKIIGTLMPLLRTTPYSLLDLNK